jgi:ribosomal protein L7Ae-like RNA K-turn-binding protein
MASKPKKASTKAIFKTYLSLPSNHQIEDLPTSIIDSVTHALDGKECLKLCSVGKPRCTFHGMVFGINATVRCIEKKRANAIVICSSLDPMLRNHVVQLCLSHTIPCYLSEALFPLLTAACKIKRISVACLVLSELPEPISKALSSALELSVAAPEKEISYEKERVKRLRINKE